MTSQLGPVAPGAAGLSSQANALVREASAAPGTPVENAAVKARTARSVDPPTSATRPAALPERDRAPLIPPDPNAPAGPPPAFEASILDRAREIGRDSTHRLGDGPSDPLSRAVYEAPHSAEERAASELATVRRIETPYDTATVDVTR